MPFDILVSGGGIGGPSLAYWLTRQGHAVTIVEQSAELRTGGQAVDFRGPALTVLEKMGLLDAVRAGATYRFGERITAIEDGGGQVGVTFGDGSTVHYDLVIGADGLHSGLRRLVFGPEERYVTQLGQCFGFFDVENRLRLDHCGMAHIDDGRTAALQAIEPDKTARASLFLADHEGPSITANPKAIRRCSRGGPPGWGGRCLICSTAWPRLRWCTSIRSPRCTWTPMPAGGCA